MPFQQIKNKKHLRQHLMTCKIQDLTWQRSNGLSKIVAWSWRKHRFLALARAPIYVFVCPCVTEQFFFYYFNFIYLHFVSTYPCWFQVHVRISVQTNKQTNKQRTTPERLENSMTITAQCKIHIVCVRITECRN